MWRISFRAKRAFGYAALTAASTAQGRSPPQDLAIFRICGANATIVKYQRPSGLPVLHGEPGHFSGHLLVLRRALEAAVWHALEDVELSGHARLAQGPVHPDRVRQEEIAGAGLQEGGWKALGEVAEQRREIGMRQVVA